MFVFIVPLPNPVPKLLVDLHVKLLRKIGKSVSADRWEKYLVKVNLVLTSLYFSGRKHSRII